MTKARRRSLCAGWLVALLLGLWAPSLSQPAGRDQPTPSPELGEPEQLRPREEGGKKEKRKVRLKHADRAVYDGVREVFYLYREKQNSRGPIEFQDEDMTLICNEAAYDSNDDTAACTGELKVTHGDSVITGKHINADFEAEVVRIKGDVKIVTTEKVDKKKPTAEGGERQPAEGTESQPAEPETRVTTITCDLVEYTYTDGARNAILTGNLKGVQEDKTVYSPKAVYDLEQDVVKLEAPVRVQMDNGSEFTTDGATISTVDEWMDTGNITGFFIRDKNKKKSDETPATPAAQPAPTEPAPTE